MRHTSCTATAAIAAALLFHGLAHAQTPTPSTTTSAPVTTDTGEITVTGSRIVQNGYSSPTPVTVLTKDLLKDFAPSSIPDALNIMPQFVNSSSNTKYTQTNPNTIAAGNFLNLRGVGSERLLVLFDGNRVPATNYTGTVDVNVLPQLLVERVDVVTGGASAGYGSDAISGIVNYVLDKKFTGVSGVVQRGVSTYGDAPSGRYGLAVGTDIGEKAHFEASAEYYNNGGVPSKCDRPHGCDLSMELGSGTADDPFHPVTNAHFSAASFGGLVGSGPFAGQTFLPNGTLTAFNAGVPQGGGISIGGDGGYFDSNPSTLTSKLQTEQAFARFSYDVSDHFKFFIEGRGAKAHVQYNVFDNFTFGAPIFSGNAFLSPALQDQLTATGTSQFAISRFFPEWGDTRADQHTSSYAGTIGATGSLFGDWKYDGQYTHGVAKVRASNDNLLNNQHFFAALDAVKDGSGNIVCRVAITNPGLYPGCTPLNIFGSGAASQAAIDYVTGSSKFNATNKMDDVSLNFSGSLFRLPAGPIAVSFGGEYRKQSLRAGTNSDPAVPVDFTGIRGVSPGTLQYIVTDNGIADGGNNVKEGYVEVAVPLLKDMVLAKSLALNGAVRYADYSNSGGAVTWKIGATYSPVEDLEFRITRSKDFRAPTLYELYAGLATNSDTLKDPVTGQTGIFQQNAGGNPNLKPETGHEWTAGVVYHPAWVPGFTIAVDYFRIDIANAIGTIDATTLLTDCFNSGGTSPECATIHRANGPDTFPTAIDTIPLNIASIKTWGLDFDASYRTNLPAWNGSLGLRAFVTYQPEFKTKNSSSAPSYDLGGTIPNLVTDNYPSWHGNISANLKVGPITAFLQEEFIGAGERSKDQYVFTDNHVPAVFYTHLDLSADITRGKTTMTAFFNVHNLFNKIGPLEPVNQIPNMRYPVAPGVYDVVGRYFTVGVRFHL